MSRKRLVIFQIANLLLALVLALSPSLSSAAGPEDLPRKGGAGSPPVEGIEVPNYPVGKANPNSPPQELKAAVALKQSLKPQQQAAIEAIVSKSMAELGSVTQSLPQPKQASYPSIDAKTKPAVPTAEQRAAIANEVQALLDTATKLQAAQTKIDSQLKAILTADQWATHQATVGRGSEKLSSAKSKAQNILSATPDTQLSTSYAYNAAAYASVGDYYAYVAFVYAYYNYVYNYYGSYSAYYYAYYAYNYGLPGLAYAAGGYFDASFLGSDFNGLLNSSVSPLGTATNYAYYGLYYAYNNYAARGYGYAYYAYYYDYYANAYLYNAYLYAYYGR